MWETNILVVLPSSALEIFQLQFSALTKNIDQESVFQTLSVGNRIWAEVKILALISLNFQQTLGKFWQISLPYTHFRI